MIKKSHLIFCLIIALGLCLGGCHQEEEQTEAVNLVIQLDLKEDIGLLIIDASLDGVETSGGISNANKTMLKRNEILNWSVEKEWYDNPADPAELSIRFRVITVYCDPNYESIYPEEYTVLLEPISFTAGFGKEYHITITGDSQNGYQAVLDQS